MNTEPVALDYSPLWDRLKVIDESMRKHHNERMILFSKHCFSIMRKSPRREWIVTFKYWKTDPRCPRMRNDFGPKTTMVMAISRFEAEEKAREKMKLKYSEGINIRDAVCVMP